MMRERILSEPSVDGLTLCMRWSTLCRESWGREDGRVQICRALQPHSSSQVAKESADWDAQQQQRRRKKHRGHFVVVPAEWLEDSSVLLRWARDQASQSVEWTGNQAEPERKERKTKNCSMRKNSTTEYNADLKEPADC